MKVERETVTCPACRELVTWLVTVEEQYCPVCRALVRFTVQTRTVRELREGVVVEHPPAEAEVARE